MHRLALRGCTTYWYSLLFQQQVWMCRCLVQDMSTPEDRSHYYCRCKVPDDWRGIPGTQIQVSAQGIQWSVSWLTVWSQDRDSSNRRGSWHRIPHSRTRSDQVYTHQYLKQHGRDYDVVIWISRISIYEEIFQKHSFSLRPDRLWKDVVIRRKSNKDLPEQERPLSERI